jgi:hypothetical protein
MKTTSTYNMYERERNPGVGTSQRHAEEGKTPTGKLMFLQVPVSLGYTVIIIMSHNISILTIPIQIRKHGSQQDRACSTTRDERWPKAQVAYLSIPVNTRSMLNSNGHGEARHG